MKARFIQLNSEYKAPNFNISISDKYVRYGDDNRFPYYLKNLLKNSGLHRAIIERKVNMLIGNGIIDEKGNDIQALPNRFETYEELIQKLTYDFEVFGGYYLQVIPRRGGGVAEIHHMPYERMRVGLPDSYGRITKFYYFPRLTEEIKGYTSINDFIEMPAYSITNKKDNQILFVKNYSPTSQYYSSPIYEGALLDIETYSQISNFHNSNLHNGFAPSYLIFFTSPEPDEDMQDAVVEQINKKYAGSENTGKPMIFFLEDAEKEPLVKLIESSEIGDQFDLLMKSIKENIVLSHQIPRQVVGLEQAGSLGNSKEIFQASQMFRTDYLEPHQKAILRGINMMRMVNNEPLIEIMNPNPNIMAFDMSELLQILTKNEVRDLFGYEALDETGMNDVNDNNETNIEE